ncbi:Uncharacterised protein [uncultured Clostridium sp.]|nr:Uncharacterised protein [uncultured Clostridium sp.]
MASINVRISSELEDKLEELQKEISKDLPRGAEVTMSSLVRGALEKLIEEYEEEKNFIVTTKTPLLEASRGELECLKEIKIHERLRVLSGNVEESDFKSRQKIESKIKKDLSTIDFILKRFKEDDLNQ